MEAHEGAKPIDRDNFAYQGEQEGFRLPYIQTFAHKGHF